MNDLSLFESDFIARTYPSIVSDMPTAFAELVANAWDAGATKVNITIPEKNGDEIIISDNGSGMTDDEFRSRWMVMAYNRVNHQGEFVEFMSEDKVKIKRIAYGRNGVGRHALVCFDDYYTIETWKNGKTNKYEISTTGGNAAFSIIKHTSNDKVGNGTVIMVKSVKKLPDPQTIIQTLGYKFIFDPQFEICVNGINIEYKNSLEPNKIETIDTDYGKLQIKLYRVPNGEKSTTNNGIAIWVNNRLVGKPSWTIGEQKVEDARRKFAIKHVIIINADFLIDDIQYDWSGLKNTQKVLDVNSIIVNNIRKYRIEYYRGKTTEVRDDVVRTNKESIRTLSIPAVYSLKSFFESYLEKKPEVEADDLNIIVSSLVNVLGNENGLSLLSKLAALSDSSITELDRILDEWSVSDIKNVLNEIDCRIKVIDAIEKLCSNPSTDELHVLHPLVSQAKWLFGIEYDNPNFTFNRTLSTVMKDFLDGKINETTSINWRKRPDLIFSSDSTLSATCTEEFDDNGISTINRVLIIELKKGGFKIGRSEMNQAEEYVDSIYKGNKLNSSPKIKAFVIGDTIDSAISKRKTQEDYGEVYAYTYQQLVQTAQSRLFNLKGKLEEHYSQYNDKDYIEMILSEPEQLELDGIKR